MAQSSSQWKWFAVVGVVAVGGALAGRYLLQGQGGPSLPVSPTEPKVDDTPLACVFARGDEQTYELKTSFDVTMDPSVLGYGGGGAGNGLATGADVEGVLRLRAMHADGDAFVVAMRLSDAHVIPRGVPGGADVKTDALARPWLVKMGKDCAFRDVGYPSDLDPRALRMLESTLQQLEVVLSVHPRDARWRATQTDGLGTYLATYQRVANHPRAVHKARGAYTSMWPIARGANMSGSQVTVAASGTDFTVDADGRWLDDLASSEDLKITTMQQELIAEVRLSTHLTAANASPSGLTDVAETAITWRTAGSPPVEIADQASTVDAGALAAMPIGAVLDAMKADLASGTPGSVARASDLLRDVLRRNPAAAGAVYDDLLAGRIDNGLAPVVFLGLQKAGTKEAQVALVRAMNEPRMGVPNRLRAVAALPQVPHPTRETLDALKGASDGRTASRDEQAVSNSATYAIGTLERRTRGKDAALSGQARDEIRAKLQSRDHQEVAAALSAIGNSGDGDLLSDLKAHTTDPDPSVRRQALEALGSMPAASDADSFASTFDGQSSPRLRALAVEGYADQAQSAGGVPPDAVVSAAVARLATEPDASVRLQLIELVGPAASARADVRAALTAEFARETDPRLESAIGEFVSAGDLP